MKKSILFYSIAAALALPVANFAQDNFYPSPTGPAQPLRMPNDAERQEKPGDTVKPPNPAAVQRQFSGAISAVSRNDKTITIDDASKVTQKLHIGDTTKMKRGDKDATWDDLKVGAKVSGTCNGEGDSAHVETININS